MERCAIVCNGMVDDYAWLAMKLAEYRTVLAADGGLTHCRGAGVKPEYVLGDMDSLEEESDVKKIFFSAEKDASDMELAVEDAVSRGFQNIDVYGALGGRIDHQICNIMVCARYSGHLRILDKNCVITCLTAGQKTRQEGRKGDIVTLAALENARCTTGGLRYPLLNEEISPGSRGLSNVVVDDTFEVSVSCGTLLIIHLGK